MENKYNHLFASDAYDTLQTLAATGSNLALMPFAGLSGLSAGLSPMLYGGEYSHERANNALDSVMSNAYSPTSEGSLEQLQMLAKLGEYAEIPSKYLGDTVTDLTGSAEAGTAAYMVPELLASLFPAKYGANAVRAGASNLQAPRSLNQALRDQAGMVAFHGSPHKFDKFDHSKMGTGEGAQAYGWGTYLAEAQDVAQDYRIVLSRGGKAYSNRNPTFSGLDIGAYDTSMRLEGKDGVADAARHFKDYLQDSSVSDRMAFDGMSYSDAFEDFRESLKRNKSQAPESTHGWYDDILSGADQVEKDIDRIDLASGSLYEVDLPDSKIDQMLDWDKPLNEQPESVRNALLNDKTYQHLKSIHQGNSRLFSDPDNFKASKFYGMIGDTQQEASAQLQKVGIPGIKYLDGNSRTDGTGTRNFVVFDENDMTIKSRNGEPIASTPITRQLGMVDSHGALGDNALDIDYRMDHSAPTKSGANTVDDMSDIFPDDVYDPSVSGRYYGHGDKALDDETARILSKLKGKPDADITIYRSVPKGVADINPGDWVTVNRKYAESHGASWVDNGLYDVIEKKVKAKEIATDGNSLHEFGYSP